MATERHYGMWIMAALCVAVVGSEMWVLRENRDLKQRIESKNRPAPSAMVLGATADRTRYEASMLGRCQPFYAAAGSRAARALDVSIYFSLDHDCLSCVSGLVEQWNREVQGPHASRFHVTGYTEVDGTYSEQILTQQLKPAFPIVRVEHISQKLETMGVTFTPVVFVSDPATGRILLTHAPLPAEKGNTAIVERLQKLITPCGA
ncbi:MAG: hypothetical protein QOH21_156 [Acidobacteriota bacterium]|nr:hypothetical protein [Acidobacteriota bacterium]